MDRSKIPFDSTKVNISNMQISLYQLLTRLRKGGIFLFPEFQRSNDLWTKEKQSRLLESYFIGLPVPQYFFDASNDEKWIVVDGLQRLSTLKNFFIDKTLRLENMEYLTDLNGLSVDEVKPLWLRRAEEAQVWLTNIRSGTPTSVRHNIFNRLNTGGLQLKKQEIRNALYPKIGRELKSVADDEKFIALLPNIRGKNRMQDREFVLTFYSFEICSLDDYYKFDSFLDLGVSVLEEMSQKDYIELKRKLISLLKFFDKLFGVYKFRKLKQDGKYGPLNKKMFEAWMYCISRITPSQRDTLLISKEEIAIEFNRMITTDETFSNSFNSALISNVRKRVKNINELLWRYL